MPRNAILLFLTAGLVLPTSAAALLCPQSGIALPGGVPSERFDAGWSVDIDNDALTTREDDQDYTAGFAVTLAGERARGYWLSLDSPLSAVDAWLGVDAARCGLTQRQHSFRVGGVALTPSDIERPDVIPDDRPYASLIFVTNGRTYVADDGGAVYQSSLTVGMLGLDAFERVQRGYHKVIGTGEPKGWDNQISDGGEPTLRYTLARQDLLASSGHYRPGGYDIKSAIGASAGYLTELSAAVSARWGLLNTTWWSFPAGQAQYLAEPAHVQGNGDSGAARRELYLWGGAALRLRGYNAFLQGQFRDSALEYEYNALHPVIGEAWFGLTAQLSRHYRLSWVVRYQSSEIKRGIGDREVFWGRITLSRAL
ncbi:lipid A deacylase LpxR family protein [Algiphilus sp.]|uniref:lipid A deacylase LpxR family protein n=1 Tax=Algiphilus sp. TaxID=1872431 RepID=UPI0025C6B32E|nr:lipid A deacylase LpxR family protein [Algiphilus sp.]MCK5769206.1 lipid A deacylase LpxR family protein [Algiphilus sp.]